MKVLRKCLAVPMLLLGLLCFAPAAGALGVDSVSTMYIEQVYANVPEMDVFVYALNSDGESISPALVNAAGVELTLGDEKLDPGTVTMAGEPVCYVFLLDDSAGIPAEAFEAYKQAVLETAQSLGERDQLEVYTATRGGIRRAGTGAGYVALSRVLTGLKQSGEKADLTTALTHIAADLDAEFQSLAPRKAMFVCTGSLALAEEPAALAALMGGASDSLNMALFTFAATDQPERLDLLSLATGGRATPVATEEISAAVAEKRDYLTKALEIKTVVDSSMGGERMDTLTLSVPSLGSAVKVSTTVYMGHTLEKPRVTDVQVQDRNHLEIRFNQPVTNASSPAGYGIRSEDAWGWQVTVREVELAEDGRTALLTTEDLYRGNYSVRLYKVASRMTAANVCGSERTAFTVEEWPADRAFYLRRFRMPALLLLAVLAVLAGAGAVQRRRDRASEAAAEVEHLLGSPADAPQLPKRWITLYVHTRGTVAETRYSVLLESSMIIGSDEALCDLALDDPRVRPQHCVLALDGGDVVVQPLDRRCAVYCGKSRIGDAYHLQNRDVLTVGGTRIQLVL
ncbi:MAG: FHA domain-containing protein [Gemmiger sp.]